uniref:NADH dehydrogenase [ubiquinone] 1 beta subcomplex subunit 7 n=1 Tax=Biomphalaria glabrata TaxID=6526 RepID=A0A2C9KSY4_BIOGL
LSLIFVPQLFKVYIFNYFDKNLDYFHCVVWRSTISTMGNMWYAYVSHPDTAPDFNKPPTFDPLLGFPNGRKERCIKATREELDKANIPLSKRDYCVDYFLELIKCRQQHFPNTHAQCSHQFHAWEQCEKEDEVLRLKEYEREKRLKERSKRIACKESLETLAE